MLIDPSQILVSVGSPMTTFKSLIVNNHGSNVIGSTQINAVVTPFSEPATATEEALKDAT
jgi:hypothetical protein